MTVRRLIILQLILLAGFGGIYLLPAQSHNQPAGVSMDLPDFVGSWFGTPAEVTKEEKEALAADTTFARRVYSDGRGDNVFASIVLAGNDPDNSMHRPERCLPAQGWTIMDSTVVTIKDPRLPNGEVKVTRLHSKQNFQDKKGNIQTMYHLNYYWFVGVNDVTPSAVRRAVLDIRDRVVKGIDQRWAYITVASVITESTTKFGRSEKATDELIQDFIAQLFPVIVKPVNTVASNGPAVAAPN